ncbi:hypothetical protein Pfo_014449 [Paulownia fortunei]|nr:hypothetical protein Pfo_014449 [Paulownia fortunei]
MSYQKVPQQNYPPPGYGTVYPQPAGYPSAPPQPPHEGYPYPPPPPSGYPYPPPPQPGGGYQGYFNQGYPLPPPPPPPQVYHCEHHHHDDGSGCTSFLRGWKHNCEGCELVCHVQFSCPLLLLYIRGMLLLSVKCARCCIRGIL